MIYTRRLAKALVAALRDRMADIVYTAMLSWRAPTHVESVAWLQ